MWFLSELNECFESKFLKHSAFTFSNCILSTQCIFLFDTLQQHNHHVFSWGWNCIWICYLRDVQALLL